MRSKCAIRSHTISCSKKQLTVVSICLVCCISFMQRFENLELTLAKFQFYFFAYFCWACFISSSKTGLVTVCNS